MKKMNRVIAALLAFGLIFSGTGSSAAVAAQNKSHIIKYQGSYDSALYPQKELDAKFTADKVVIDGILEDAYENAPVSKIENLKLKSEDSYEEGKETYGEISAVWDGPTLYLGIKVYDSDVIRSTGLGGESTNPAIAAETETTYPYAYLGGFWATWGVTSTKNEGDSIELGFDLHNDKVVYETDTQGVVTIGADGHMYYYHSSNIPSLGSPLGDPKHPEYMDRITGYASAPLYDGEGNEIGYTVEVGLAIENVDAVYADNGLTFGVDVKINDYQNVIKGYEEKEIPNPDYEAPAEGEEGETVPEYITVQEPVFEKKKLADVFWSHEQDEVYTEFNHEHTNSVDWGNVTLTGWDGVSGFAYSSWRIDRLLRYIESDSFAKGVYTEDTQMALDAAVAAAKEADLTSEDKVTAETLAANLEAAFYGLRWGNTKYPDPAELPSLTTLPNPYKFFASDRIVESTADWEERREEILDLAQFYEYGYKPEDPDSVSYSVEYHEAGETKYRWSTSRNKYVEDGVYASTEASVTMNITVGEKTEAITFSIAYPTAEQLAASGNEGREIPILLSYDGTISEYLDRGIAVASVPSVVSDTRTNEYAWGERTGQFYNLYPYHRNGEKALNEVSNEMAEAWVATRMIDALEALKASEDEAAVVAMAGLDPTKLAVTGFSINGKYAFVAGVFDDRIGVTIPGASGASGASAWRLVYTGHEYDFSGTPFASKYEDVPNLQIASGTEMMANSVRHNRVRETELFRHFLQPFNFYGYEDGAYGFGNRLPYDQTDLIASLAPRAIVIENTTNDYNDGCEADALSAEVAKAVYNTLGYEADDLVKFNYRSLRPSDPHGNDSAQRGRSADFVNSYFFGTAMSDDTAERLNADPFALNVTNGDTAYNVYYGGYNTITGGTGGAEGRDGWYYYSLPQEEEPTPGPEEPTPVPADPTPGPEEPTPVPSDPAPGSSADIVILPMTYEPDDTAKEAPTEEITPETPEVPAGSADEKEFSLVEKKTLYRGGTTGKTFKLFDELPENIKSIKCTSKNSKICKVTKNTGKLTAVAPGKTTIKAVITYTDGTKETKNIKVTVKKASFVVKKSVDTLKEGESGYIKLALYGYSAADCSFIVSDPELLRLSSPEAHRITNVKALKAGGTVITVKVGGKTEEIAVSVTE